MSLYVMADWHLSAAAPEKSMDVFGNRWSGYMEKIRKNMCAIVTDEDTVVIPGDISWALTLQDSGADFDFIHSLPGKKIIGKGNHDFWWTTMAKTERFLSDRGIADVEFLYNNAFYRDGFILCGTRGWFADASNDKIPENTDYEKMVAREASRLALSLECGEKLKAEYPEAETLVFVHFPVYWNGIALSPMIEVLKKYGVHRVYFGHIHGNYTVPARLEYEGISFSLISADYLNFCPRPILPL